MVELGFHTGQQNLSMDELRALWRRLDAAGADWISVWDHIYEVPVAGGTQPHYEAVATLGALCADTTSARIGSLVFYVGYRNPALLAKSAATLDHISSGRFELGIGSGWAEVEALAFGYEFPSLKVRMDMLEDALPMVRSLLDNDRTTHEGPFYRVTDAANQPPPLRRMPLWVGGIGETRTLRMAARWADGWNAAYISAPEFRRLNQVLDDWCEVEGRDPHGIERSINMMFHLALDEAEVAAIRAEIERRWGDMYERVLDGALIGTPQQVIEQMLELVDAGAQGINAALRAPINEAALEAYLTEVMPAVRAATG